MRKTGILYIVATPIGNLRDMTHRAIEILSQVNWIAAEDTRQSQKLLHHWQIKTPLISLHQHNEMHAGKKLVERLKNGENIALISDAGTPLISDPGEYLIRLAIQEGIEVSPIPGPCAAIAALSASGLATHKFVFVGFLSSKSTERQRQLTALQYEVGTTILYEAPHRVLDLLAEINTVLGARKLVLAKELTKTFETIKRGTALDLQQWLTQDPVHLKGEFVILIEGFELKEAEEPQGLSPETQKILKILLADLPIKQAITIAAKITGEKRNFLYEQALLLNNGA
jgi:16S rRNA (cytidine1402-2'-O)-methyltransferase